MDIKAQFFACFSQKLAPAKKISTDWSARSARFCNSGFQMATDLCDSDVADDGGDDDNAGNHLNQKILCKTWTMKTILCCSFHVHMTILIII